MKTKNLLLICLLFGVVRMCLSAQTLYKKSPAAATHTITITLKPGVTVNQYMEFMINKYIPEYEKNFCGSKMHTSEKMRGNIKNQYFAFVVFESLKDRDKYYLNGTGISNEGEVAWKKMDSITLEGNSYVWDSLRVNADWVIALDEVVVK